MTCFGYTGYKNARFGRIEAHEAICSWAREILLKTIDIAEQEGWQVLHAIVDCVWICNDKIQSKQKKLAEAKRFAERVSKEIGIPLEFEDIYHYIGFLPSRMHNAGSLTKYWAEGEKGLKIRGIESRQHSTCSWVKNLQNSAFEIIKEWNEQGGDVFSSQVQNTICAILHEQLVRLEQRKIPAHDLVITRRISKTLDQLSVKNLTYSALTRANCLGHEIIPGRKARFVVLESTSNQPIDRVILAEEISTTTVPKIDYQYYRNLAVRAIWAILAPFGWTEEEISSGVKTATLDDFMLS